MAACGERTVTGRWVDEARAVMENQRAGLLSLHRELAEAGALFSGPQATMIAQVRSRLNSLIEQLDRALKPF